MKVFRKGNSQREFRQSFKSQSAMEYLMTYGWAILIIAVVLAALFELGVFNPMTFAPKASPGSCQVVRPEGAGTTNFISLEGECNGELPQYVAQFNGQSSKITVPISTSIDLVPSLTITTYAYIKPVPRAAWLFREGISNNYANFGMFVYYNSTIKEYTLALECPDKDVLPSNTVVNLNTWNFLALEITSAANIKLIVNGKPYPVSSSCTFSTNPSYGVELGGYNPSTNNEYLNGSQSDIQLYNTSLSANEIQALYQEGIGGAPIDLQNLVGWWPLNGNANDYSGNGNNGVPTSITYTSNWYSGYSAP